MEAATEKSSPIDERDLIVSMRKLDLIKELGEKQMHFQRLQQHLNQNTDLISRENQVLREFRKELDQLVQERMSHIEELRLIHADINIMETTIKQAEEERGRALQESKRLLKEYQPIKDQISKLREMLQLEKLNDNDEDETAAFTMQLLNQQSNDLENAPSNRPGHLSSDIGSDHSLIVPFLQPSQTTTNSALTGPISTGTSSSGTNPSQANTPTALHSSKMVPSLGSTIDRTAFRQQPPPMKTCQSCQQQIHRNAPICPICKAKSRSRNPKKPKRRHTDVPS